MVKEKLVVIRAERNPEKFKSWNQYLSFVSEKIKAESDNFRKTISKKYDVRVKFLSQTESEVQYLLYPVVILKGNY